MRKRRSVLGAFVLLGMAGLMGCAAYPEGMPEDTKRESTSVSAGDTDPQNTASGAGTALKPSSRGVTASNAGVTTTGMGAPGTESRDPEGR
jgi:hypothetical protein